MRKTVWVAVDRATGDFVLRHARYGALARGPATAVKFIYNNIDWRKRWNEEKLRSQIYKLVNTWQSRSTTAR